MKRIKIQEGYYPVFEKTRSLINLNKLGLLTPYTYVFNNFIDYDLNYISKQVYHSKCHIKCVFSDKAYPHSMSEILDDVSTIREKIDLFREKIQNLEIKKYDLIVQPIVNVKWGGAILKKENFFLLEIVYGSPSVLFTHGRFKFRLLLDNNIDIISFENGCQVIENKKTDTRFFSYIKNLNIFKKKLFRKTLERLDNNYLFEFGVNNGKVILFECKQIKEHMYPSIVINYPFIVNLFDDNRSNVNINYPELKNIELMNEKTNIIVEHGGVLSHLATYSSILNNGCLFLGA